MTNMKWWGWGAEDFEFPMANKPDLWPFIRRKSGLSPDARRAAPVQEKDVRLSPPEVHPELLRALRGQLKEEQIRTDDRDRLVHAYGKSFPDLFRARRGVIERAPDLVVYPDCHDEVEFILNEAKRVGAKVVPFGGGTNIVGGVEHRDAGGFTRVTLDLRRMNRLLDLDPRSQTATLEAGAVGPVLEETLQAKGYSLGHYPDSFEYSTLGGWLATRSAGMQSDAYGKIEDMVVALKLVTPVGTLRTRVTPATSAGPDLDRMVCGSEGVLGVITEATMRVHPNPEVKDYKGWLFPSFAAGVEAMQECVVKDCPPSMFRLQDEPETELAFCMRSPPKGFKKVVEGWIMGWLKSRGYATPAMMLVGLEGCDGYVRSLRKRVTPILKKHGGFCLGGSIGRKWSESKFHIPYLRDVLMDYNFVCDVAETAGVWSKLLELYTAGRKSIEELLRSEGKLGYIGCHVSHTYHTGASLYFTWATLQDEGRELEQYYRCKRAITDAFMRTHGTLTHHHAVGYEHRPWMAEEVGATGLRALRGLKQALDPDGIMNPGKLLPEE